MLKRGFDILCACALLLVSAPLFALVALAIKLDNPGPVFYWQRRLGRGGTPFFMAKFRKMPVALPKQGPLLTRRYDARLTRIGRWLERTKLDELPQLLNVLRGEMSLVGPRPEVERFVGRVDEDPWRSVLSVRPGIFGLSQLRFRNESERYPEEVDDLEAYYRERILPEKLASDVEYVRRASLPWDAYLIVACVFVSLFGTLTLQGLREQLAQLVRLLLDTALAVATMGLALTLLGASVSPAWLTLVAVVRLAIFAGYRTHRRLPASLTSQDIARLGCAVAVGSLLFAGAAQLLTAPSTVPALALLLDALLLASLLVAKALTEAHLHALHAQVTRYAAFPLQRPVTLVALATVASFATFGGMLALEQGVVLAQQPASAWVVAVVLLVVTGAIRLVGYTHTALAGTRPFTVTALGSALIVVSDTVLGTQLIAFGTVLVEAVVTLVLTFLLARYAVLRRLRRDGEAQEEGGMVLVGLAPRIEALLAWAGANPRWRGRILGVVATEAYPARRGQSVHDTEVLGSLGELPALLDAKPVRALGYLEQAITAPERERIRTLAEQHNLPLIELGEMPSSTAAQEGDATSAPATSTAPLPRITATQQ